MDYGRILFSTRKFVGMLINEGGKCGVNLGDANDVMAGMKEVSSITCNIFINSLSSNNFKSRTPYVVGLYFAKYTYLCFIINVCKGRKMKYWNIKYINMSLIYNVG